MVNVHTDTTNTTVHVSSANSSGNVSTNGDASWHWAEVAEMSAEEAKRYAELAEHYAEMSISAIWIKVQNDEFVEYEGLYRYTINGIMAIISVYSGGWDNKELLSGLNITVTDEATYIDSSEPFNGYVLASKAILASEDYIPATKDDIDELSDEIEALSDRINNMPDTFNGSDLIEVNQNGQMLTFTSKTFEFEQGVASDEWVIVHNLGKKPTVVTVDSAGTQFQGRIIYDSYDQCTVYINGATTGKAYLN